MKLTRVNAHVLRTVFRDADVVSNRVEEVHYPHLKRCLELGLIAVGESKLMLTDAGRVVRDEQEV